VSATDLAPSGGLPQQEINRLARETRQREVAERSRKDQDAILRQLDGLVANAMRSVPSKASS
jgi:hypothetical protein